MRLLALLLVCLSLTANAQNWALLNPAYKYNYSNDGTDTISNQVFVTNIDTLGPDSFRYELNRIGVVCDTCPASLGGPCDGCYVRVNQPQFLGFDCIRSGGDWLFLGPDTFLIRSDASVGATWSFNASTGITATVDAEWSDSLFTIPDTLRRILISTGDTVLLSRSFGIVHMGTNGQHFSLIGVEGAAVGFLLPDPMTFFDFHAGDELTYRIGYTYTATPPGGPWFPQIALYYWKVFIMGREDFQDSIRYVTSVARSASLAGYPSGYTIPEFWPVPPNPWVLDRATLNQQHPILSAYPGQMLDRTAVWDSGAGTGYLAEHTISDNGRHIARSESLLVENCGINLYATPLPDLHPFFTGWDPYATVNVQYEEGIGLIQVMLRRQMLTVQDHVTLVGAIIGNDTIIPPPAINWVVGLDEASENRFGIHPNPAANTCYITGLAGREQVTLFDMEGRVVLVTMLGSDHDEMDVSVLSPGTYVVRVGVLLPQRLVIAR